MCEDHYQIQLEVSKFLNVQPPNEKQLIVTNNYHLVAGNPIRHNGILNVQYDERWKKRLSSIDVNYLNNVSSRINPFFDN